jgi:uncharacterized membrane protein YcaP (DUF421 family)
MQTNLLEVILRTGAIYAVLYVALRLLGKREISQFTPFDLVLLLVLANAVQNAMVGDNTSLGAGIAAALTLLLLNYALDRALSRHLGLRHWLEGVPTLLLRHGKIEWPAMKREHVDMAVLMTAIREHGLEEIKDVDLAVLELDGSISIIGKDAASKRKTPVKTRRRRARFSRLR